MGYIYLLTLLLFSIVEAKEILMTPCVKTDYECMMKSTKEYISKTYGGLGEPYNIEAYDPIEIPSMDIPGCCTDPPLSMFHFKNMKITGMKDFTLTGYRREEDTKMCHLNSTVDYIVTADMTLEYTNPVKSFSGSVTIKPKVKAHTHYTYEIKKDDKGEEHFSISPETTSCEITEDPEFEFDDQLKETMFKDPDVKAKTEKFPNELVEKRKQMGCKIAEISYKKFFESLRAALKVLTTADIYKQ